MALPRPERYLEAHPVGAGNSGTWLEYAGASGAQPAKCLRPLPSTAQSVSEMIGPAYLFSTRLSTRVRKRAQVPLWAVKGS